MNKIVDIRNVQLRSMIKGKTTEELLELFMNEEFISKLQNITPMLEYREAESISTNATNKIAKYVQKKHGRLGPDNAPTKERRKDYYNMCTVVASSILSRALAMYEPEEREPLMKDFSALSLFNAQLVHAENLQPSKGSDNYED